MTKFTYRSWKIRNTDYFFHPPHTICTLNIPIQTHTHIHISMQENLNIHKRCIWVLLFHFFKIHTDLWVKTIWFIFKNLTCIIKDSNAKGHNYRLSYQPLVVHEVYFQKANCLLIKIFPLFDNFFFKFRNVSYNISYHLWNIYCVSDTMLSTLHKHLTLFYRWKNEV